MDKMKKFSGVFFGSICILLLAVAPALAFDGAILSSIDISSKDNYSYKIVLKTNKSVHVQKHVASDNKIVLDINNAQPAEFVNTVYNNSPEINSVVVQPVSGDKVRVFIEGLNISASRVVLDSRTETGLPNDGAPAIAVNTDTVPAASEQAPKAYESKKVQKEIPVINLADSPIPEKDASIKADAGSSEINGLLLDETVSHTPKDAIVSRATLKKIFSKEGFDWVLRIFASVFIIIGIAKFFSRPKKVTVDLSASDNLKNRELEMLKAALDKKDLLSKSLGGNNLKENPVDNIYGANSHYGIKEYQNSQQPPKKLSRPVDINEMKVTPRSALPRATGIKHSESIPSILQNPNGISATIQQKNNVSAEVQRQQRTSPALQTKGVTTTANINLKDIKTARSQADNIQFLETMAAIYQKSGREDLAKNIRKSILKSKAAV